MDPKSSLQSDILAKGPYMMIHQNQLHSCLIKPHGNRIVDFDVGMPVKVP